MAVRTDRPKIIWNLRINQNNSYSRGFLFQFRSIANIKTRMTTSIEKKEENIKSKHESLHKQLNNYELMDLRPGRFNPIDLIFPFISSCEEF